MYLIFVVLLIFGVAALMIKFEPQITKVQQEVYRLVGKVWEKIVKIPSRIRKEEKER